ncbi:MAG: hypothetical protein ACR2I1_08310 [Propionibacteriaceae bacterium]
METAGHYHRSMLSGLWRPGWQVLELDSADVTEQRRVRGWRRVKTDAIDLEAITGLVLTGRGVLVTARLVVIGRLPAWAARRSRRVPTRTATKSAHPVPDADLKGTTNTSTTAAAGARPGADEGPRTDAVSAIADARALPRV